MVPCIHVRTHTHTGAALRAMLESVSYKKEIILTSLSSADEQTVWLDPVRRGLTAGDWG